MISAGVKIIQLISVARHQPDAKFFIGSGKVQEIGDLVLTEKCSVVIFNHELSPGQEKNLEEAFKVKVLDRTGLILDIFAQRARTFEGKLQVELAQLAHLSTRLVRGWTHLERQKGGIGLRGPGETQLETDRRLIKKRIHIIKERLEKVRSQRQQNRRSRQKKPVLTLSLVGYTNAGKSTLFNALTEASVYVADQLFATLDPTLRRIQLPEVGTVVLADTVGFIRQLPHSLVDAFRATLEETRSADLLLHVIDLSQADWQENKKQVDAVLEEIGAADIPHLLIYNKIDLLSDLAPRIDCNEEGLPQAVYVSAQASLGLDLLKEALAQFLSQDYVVFEAHLTATEAKLRAQLYERAAILKETTDEAGGWLLLLRLSKTDLAKFFSHESLAE